MGINQVSSVQNIVTKSSIKPDRKSVQDLELDQDLAESSKEP